MLLPPSNALNADQELNDRTIQVVSIRKLAERFTWSIQKSDGRCGRQQYQSQCHDTPLHGRHQAFAGRGPIAARGGPAANRYAGCDSLNKYINY